MSTNLYNKCSYNCLSHFNIDLNLSPDLRQIDESMIDSDKGLYNFTKKILNSQ